MRKFKANKNLSKKFISLTLCSIITLSTLVGCSNKNMWFKGSNLKYVSVIRFEDETMDISSSNSYCSPRVCNGKHKVYKSAINGEMFTDDDCKAKSSADYLGTTLHKYPIESIENITSYLTLDELQKANKNELTEENISNIIVRIFDEENNVQKTKKAN